MSESGAVAPGAPSDDDRWRRISQMHSQYGDAEVMASRSCVMRFFGKAFTRTLRPEDSRLTVQLKQTIFVATLIPSALAAYSLATTGNIPEGANRSFWVYVWTIAALAWGASAMGYLQIMRSFPLKFLDASVLFMTVFCIVPADYKAALYMTGPMWPLFVICVDCTLVFRSPKWVRVLVVCISMSWLFIQQLESVGIGVLHDPFNPRGSVIPAACDCAAPPCGNTSYGSAVVVFLAWAFVFLLDYQITSGFASALHTQQEANAAAAVAVETIAECLAGFDLEAAKVLLSGDRAAPLPPKMRRAFWSILNHLRSYRPYLPQSCLPGVPGTPTLPDEGPEDVADDISSLGSCHTGCDHQVVTPAPDAARRRPSVSAAEYLTAQRVRQAVMRPSKVTLLQSNLHNLMDTPASAAATLAAVVSLAVDITEHNRGVIDMFLGDKLMVSFNGARPSARHSTNAVEMAKDLYSKIAESTQHGVNIAVATGRVTCGDAGCTTLRRFTLLGALPSYVAALERVGRILGIGILCNEDCATDAGTGHEVKCLPRQLRFLPCRLGETDPTERRYSSVSVPDVGDGDGDTWCIFEVLLDALEAVAEEGDDHGAANNPRKGALCDTAKSTSRSSSLETEWMYELANSPPAQWERYNDVMLRYLRGGSVDMALEAIRGDPKAALMEKVLTTSSLRPVDHRV